MSTSYLKYCRLTYLSQPACERSIYRQIAKLRPAKVLEIGLGLGIRTIRMLDVAARYRSCKEIHYTGIDLFEARPANEAALSLKDAYKLLKANGTQVKLVPGDALGAMTLTANAAANTDLIVIDSDVADSDLEQAWRYFPRMMHDNTLVMRQYVNDQRKYFEKLDLQMIQTRAASQAGRKAA